MFCGIKYVVPLLYSMAPKVKKTGPSSKIGKRPGQGSRITSQTKYIIHNIKNCFNLEKCEQQTILRNKVHDRVAVATALSWRTVFNISRLVTPDNTYLTPTSDTIGLEYVLTQTPLTEQQLNK